MLRCWVVNAEQLWLAEASHRPQVGYTQSLATPSTPLLGQDQMGQALSQGSSGDRAWTTQVRVGWGPGLTPRRPWGGAQVPHCSCPCPFLSPGNLLSPAPMDWDMLMEPPFLFTAVPPNGELAPPAVPPPPQAPHCHVVIRALCGEQPMCWEVGIGLETLWGSEEDGSLPLSPTEREGAWDQALHRLTAASVVRDNEQLALRRGTETMADQGEWQRYRSV